MIEIKSYLLKPYVKITDLTAVNKKPNDYFISIQNSKEIKEIKNTIDLNYVSGAICINYYEDPILDFTHWDLVDQLWSYIIDLVEKFESFGNAETYFPDQPIRLELKRINTNLMVVCVDESKHTVESSVFLEKLLDSAEIFFTSMHQYFNINTYSAQLQKIELLRK
ncbi:hypothetical protein [Paenibacillus sp. EPM92]|uniref:hypothetical protein n=1 Tax=Paenibacillus sp. EPM92 TaxID=1561195 RepID=UPI0019164DA7|nr:hypothetical protein [Paenibacillus sp. EPM92]